MTTLHLNSTSLLPAVPSGAFFSVALTLVLASLAAVTIVLLPLLALVAASQHSKAGDVQTARP